MVTRAITNEPLQDAQAEPRAAGRSAVVSIHQPNYIPWLGYFFKIAHADKFVFLDSVQYSNGSFINRNNIKTQSGAAWLTIPVLRSKRSSQLIMEVETDRVQPWRRRHLSALRTNYAKAPYFREIFALLEPHYGDGDGRSDSLAGFNVALICAIAAYLNLRTEFVRARDLQNLSGHKTDLLRDICLALGATSYLAGSGATSYQEDDKLKEAGITPVYSTFTSPTYPQQFGEFVANLSIVDVLMNCGASGTRRLLGLEPEID